MARQRDANAVRLCEGKRALRSIAGIVDSTLVRRDHRRRQLGYRLTPLAPELRAEPERVGCVSRAELPVPRPPLQQAQVPQRVRLLGVFPDAQRVAPLLEEWPSLLELARPDELVDHNRGRSGRPRQRPLERERLVHLRARNSPPDVEVEEPEHRECPAPERGVPDT